MLAPNDPDYREVEVVGSALDIASFRLYMKQLTNYILEETPFRIRFVAGINEMGFIKNFSFQKRVTRDGKAFIFLMDADVNNNLDSLARTLNN